MITLNDVLNVIIICASGILVLTLTLDVMPVAIAFLFALAVQVIVAVLLVGLDRAIGLR